MNGPVNPLLQRLSRWVLICSVVAASGTSLSPQFGGPQLPYAPRLCMGLHVLAVGAPGGACMLGWGRIEGGFGGMVSAFGAVIWWGKPKGDEPGWLSRGKQAMKAEETLRETLDKEIEVSISSTELLQALEIILGQHWIPYTANQAGMDAPVVMLEAKGKVRDVLRRVLRPMQLDYVIHQDSLQIVNPREDQFQRTIRVYDLAHVISNSQDMGKVLQLIESTVQPDQWHTQSGQSLSLINH